MPHWVPRQVLVRNSMPTVIDPNNLQDVLSGLEGKDETMDPRVRQQAAVLAFGRRTTAQPAISILMQDAGALVAEILQTDYSGVAELVDGGSTLMLRVSDSDLSGKAAHAMTHRGPLDPTSSLAAHALNTASPVVCADLKTDSRFRDLFLRKLGMTSAVCVPLHLAQKAFGALAVYSKSPRQFTADDVRFAETIAHLLTSSVARLKVEEELREYRVVTSMIMEMVDGLVLTLDPEGVVAEINHALQQASGKSPAEVRGRFFWDIFMPPEEVEFVRKIFRSTLRDKGACEFESNMQTKQGACRRIGWTLKVMPGLSGQIHSVMLIGFDRTEQVETEKELQRLREAAERATKALAEYRSAAEMGSQADGQPDAAKEAAPAANGPGETGPLPFQPVGAKHSKDLRTSPRRNYQYRQTVAPMFGRELPPQTKFFEVECKDISAGGIAFYLDRPPDFENVVVALGRPPAQTHFTARVVRIATLRRDGKRCYLIGCRFTGRVVL